MDLLREERCLSKIELKDLVMAYQQKPKVTWNWILGVLKEEDEAEHRVRKETVY